MNKFISAAMFLLFWWIFCTDLIADTKIAVRSATLFHSSRRFRHIYGNVNSCVEIEGSMLMPQSTSPWGPYELWANLDWFSKEKKVDHCCHTRVRILNLSIGAQYAYAFSKKYDVYLGIGGRLGNINLHNKSCCISEKVSNFAVGLVFKSGARAYLSESIFANYFIDYACQPVKYHNWVDIGGLKIGLGLGTHF